MLPARLALALLARLLLALVLPARLALALLARLLLARLPLALALLALALLALALLARLLAARFRPVRSLLALPGGRRVLRRAMATRHRSRTDSPGSCCGSTSVRRAGLCRWQPSAALPPAWATRC
ncbi:hypothetical protein Q3V37_30730 [Micromonospora profundi]|uniref:Uncharacterized protein n=1 Tax=Micromonospora profundi TaxID=1420889 RepID=A0AAJ6HVA5_9ACTN|nr:hypothetical protein [Micromonospora profundi]WLS45663.1 hypothetical protein Q3V37_30730 [Micromonospora profundi]